MMDRKKKNYKISIVFCITTLISLLLLLICFLESRGELISSFFFHDSLDSGMDFFHSLEYVNRRSPYADMNTLYPPLANLFFWVLLRIFVPDPIRNSWLYDFTESISMRGTSLDLRTAQSTFIIYILFVVFMSCVIFGYICNFLQIKHNKQKVALACIFSYGYLYALERGNVIILCFLLLLVFLKNRNSEDRLSRELSLIALAVAAGLKLYPALFGIILLRDKNWKAAIRAIIYGILSLILPCFFFKEGIAGLASWIRIVLGFSENGSISAAGTGIRNIIIAIEDFCNSFLGTNFEWGGNIFVQVLITVVVLTIALLIRSEWESVLLIVMAMLLFQDQGAYMLVMFNIPMLCFMNEETQFSNKNILQFIGMLACILPLPLFDQHEIFYPHIFIVQVTLIIMTLYYIILFLKEEIASIRKNKF